MATLNITPIFWSVIRIIPRIPRNNLSKILSIKKNFAVDEGIALSSTSSGTFIIKFTFKELVQSINDITNNNDINAALFCINEYENYNTVTETNNTINDLDKLFSAISL